MEDFQPLITDALRAAGEAGLTRARLVKAVGGKGPAAREAVAAFAHARLAVNLGTEKSPRYILPEFDRRLERACQAIRQRATPGKATVFNAATLRKGHARGVQRAVVDQAIGALVARRELFVIQPGKSVFYLHARSIAPLMTPLPPEEPTFSPEAVREAYAGLVREGGFADVPIDQLARRSHAPLDALKAWLLAESRAGRAAPTRGDWSLAAAPARAAAIALRGEPHLQIRLL